MPKALRDFPEAAPALKADLAKSDDAEQKSRLKAVLSALAEKEPATARMQAERAVAALHTIGDGTPPEALSEVAAKAAPR